MTGAKKKITNYSGLIKKTDGSIPQIPCSVFALSRIFALMTGYSALNQLNEIFTMLNNAGVSLPMFHSYEPIYQYLDFKTLSAKTTISGSKRWSLNLFEMDVCVC